MWTPKRVLLLAFGFVTFCAAYVAYAQVLGGIDGLPALPEKFHRRETGGPFTIEPPMVTQVQQRLQQAFGDGCRELKMLIQVESPRGVVIASKDCVFQPGGREIRLTPVSLAFFSRPVGNRYPEINTIRGATATLFLDQPISGPLDIGKRRIVAAELYGVPKKDNDPNSKDEPIEIRNNRHTQRQGDDLVIIIPNGPVYFDDEKRLIHTKDVVNLEDLQSQPIPTRVTATGLKVHLAAGGQAGGGRGGNNKPRPEGTGPVERIVLLADVDMHLYSEPGSSFLNLGAPARPAAPAAPGAAPPPKDETHITTGGPFVYDLTQNRGRFDVPEKASPFLPERVCVVRNPDQPGQETSKEDRLECEHLELQFQRKAPRPAEAGPPPAAGNDDPGTNLEIEWAHAWGQKVKIKSVVEKLDGEGNDLYYQAPIRKTVLKGEPRAVLVKDCDEIYARELAVIDQRDRGTQQVTANGPGSIHLADKKTRKLTQHARWAKEFKSERVGNQDLLTFEGGAAFVEDDQLRPDDVFAEDKVQAARTFLKADELQVWLEPPPPTAAPAARPPAPRPGELPDGGSGRRPRRLEATGHVVARSPEMHILEPPPELRRSSEGTRRLTLFFEDVPEAPAPATTAAAPVAAKPADPPPPGPEPIIVPAAPTKPEPPPKPVRPVELSASIIRAHINRSPSGRTELDRLETEGAVYVVKEPSGDDKGFSIKGDKLELKRKPTGNHLRVTGDSGNLAELYMDQLTIVGPEVEIDQGDNTATVEGEGFMRMQNKTDLSGTALDKPEWLTVFWEKLMRFHGDFAEFHGNIHAEQTTSRLKCQTLKVEFDKPISLSDQHHEKKDAGPGNEPARAKRLECETGVLVEQEIYEKNTPKLTGFKSLASTVLIVQNLERTMTAPGPGVVRLVQPGGAGVALGGPPPKTSPARGAKPADAEWALTIVTYGRFGDALGKNQQGGGRMDADNNKHTAIFYEDVQVLHVPWTSDPKRLREPVSIADVLEKLPPGALYMECRDKLKVYSREEAAGKATDAAAKQVMTGFGQVYLKATDAKGQLFWGTAEEVHYDQEKEQVIFDGKGGLAEVYQVERRGEAPKKTVAKKITYSRTDGKVTVDNATQISGGTGHP